MDAAKFDPTVSYVTAAGGRYAGHNLAAYQPVKVVDEPTRPGELTTEQAEQLVTARKIIPAKGARPTPVERPEDAVERLTEMERMDGDKFLIRAPWLAESLTVSGEAEALKALADTKEKGLEAYRNAETTAAKTLDGAGAADVGGATLTGGDGFSMVEDGSNGYYTITLPDGSTERVRGKAKAEEKLAELRAAAVKESEPPPPPETPDADDEADTSGAGES